MRAWLLLACLIFLTACGSKVSVNQTYDEREDLGEASYGSSVEFQSDDKNALGQAKAAIRNQDYAQAATALRQLYDNPSVDREVREEALYLLAEVQSNLLNPERNNAQAIATYERFLEEFPRSDFAFRAEESLARLQAQEESAVTPE